MGMPGAVADSGSTNQLFPPASAQEMPRQEEGFLAGGRAHVIVMWCELKASYSLLECKTYLTWAKRSFLAQKTKRVRECLNISQQMTLTDMQRQSRDSWEGQRHTQSLKSWCSYALHRKIFSRQYLNCWTANKFRYSPVKFFFYFLQFWIIRKKHAYNRA